MSCGLAIRDQSQVPRSLSYDWILPAGIDPHTHLAMPVADIISCDDYFSGQSAALAGGTTMHIDFALPVGGDLMAGFKEWQRTAERAVMPYSWHMAITNYDEKVEGNSVALLHTRAVSRSKWSPKRWLP